MQHFFTPLFVLGITACLLTAAVFAEGNAVKDKVSERPNILFIYSDDQSPGTIAALGHPIVKTPNLDKLVHQGTSFTNAYNQGGWNGAICIASRSMLNTGRFLWNAQQKIETELRPEKDGGAKPAERAEAEAKFWSQLLKKAGYKTYFTGKWHIEVPVKNLFDIVGFERGGMPPTVEASYNRPVENEEDEWSPSDPKFKGHWEGGTHWSELLADKSIEFIGEAAKHDEPFFMYLAFNAPHDPRQSPKEYSALLFPHQPVPADCGKRKNNFHTGT
ncbi:hypothetical protein FACS189419_06490 [Planctomycetales bacterium]|nr:hypothetical protein FACS189419_06490 [Planctomycetales bacterium]